MQTSWHGDGRDFGGAKIAVLVGESLLTIQRDDIPTIPHPGLWDLPGGGREGCERPERTALRELEEELGLAMDPARIVWRHFYPGDWGAWFFAARWPELRADAVRFGDEGQGWALMPVADFLSRRDAVPALQARLRHCLTA